MENVNKYFTLLENLNYEKSDTSIIKSNINLIQKYLKVDLENLCKNLTLCAAKFTEDDLEWTYFCLLVHILLTLKSQINFNSNSREDLISVRNLDDFTKAIIAASKYGIRYNLLPEMQQHEIFQTGNISKSYDYCRLQSGINFIKEIMEINIISSNSSIDVVKLEAMAAAICLLTTESVDENNKQIARDLLNFFWNHTCKIKYLRNLLILKSIKHIPMEVQKFLHENLLAKLQDVRGFNILLDAMLPQMQSDVPNWKLYEVISNIVAHKGHSSEFFDNLIKQIFEFINNCIGKENMRNLIPAGVLTLRKLYLLKNNLKIRIKEKVGYLFRNLIEPEDLITGSIVMDDDEIKLFVNILNFIFCGSSMQSLPSEILVNYLPVLIQLYSQFPANSKLKENLKIVIVQCLANREKIELKELINNFFQVKKLQKLHPRISVKFNEKISTFTIQICAIESVEDFEISFALTEILKTSNNNILIYNSFIGILSLLEEYNYTSDNENTAELLQDDKELEEFLKRKFKLRFSIITSLTDLISFKQFHSQFHENPKEILDFIKKSVEKRLNPNSIDQLDENISLILALFQEILENSKDTNDFKNFLYLLEGLLKYSSNLSLKNQIENLIYLINNGGIKRNEIFEKSQYNFARNLIEESQSHLRVYGISLMIKLIKTKDEETLANRHAVLALALHALRDEESYTFLNCIKLFVTLINVMEGEVLEILSDEYLNDNEKTDFRLKLGETILKVTEELGPLSYKYKGILLNCFLSGCRHQLDEFRCSSLSNLATICRLLTYQVHNFFQELLQLITSILEAEKYLPAKRAAVLVISQLFCGMDDLVDYQEYLLPLYRLLKFIIENEQDEVIRVHATNGLKTLSDKCKKMLLPDNKLEKEIQILGIKDNVNSKNKSKNILELN